MQKIKTFIISLSVFTLLSGVALVTPASARDGHGSDDNRVNNPSTQTGASDQLAENNSSISSNAKTESEASDLVEQFREQAKEKTQEARDKAKEHTQAEREKSCTARKTALTKRMNNTVAQAQRHKQVFDKIYARVKEFHDTKQLNITNYDSLTANVDKAQTDAEANITALSSLDVSVDCSSQTVAASVGAFQQAVKNTRDSLKAYRSALVELIKALKGASTGSESTADNSSTNQSNQ